MIVKQKSELIATIIQHLKFEAGQQNKAFNEGDTFLSLCFKSDDQLLKIAKLTGV